MVEIENLGENMKSMKAELIFLGNPREHHKPILNYIGLEGRWSPIACHSVVGTLG